MLNESAELKKTAENRKEWQNTIDEYITIP